VRSDVNRNSPYHLIKQIGLPLDLPVGGISCRDTLLSCCDNWRVPGQSHATSRTVTCNGTHERAAARKSGQRQVEDEETVPDRLADDAVVAIVPVPPTVH
jgi:hypothetical protein